MATDCLWYDDDKKRTLEQKITDAATFYTVKFGAAPTHCWVHRSVLAEDKVLTIGGVIVKSRRTALVNHFQLGTD